MDASQTRISLLGRLKNAPNDEQAWHDFVDRYGRKIYRWCRHWGLQDADAEDVTQALLLKLVAKLGEFTYDTAKGSFRGWLKTLAHHAWHDFVQARNAAERGAGDSGLFDQLHSRPARDDLVARLKEEFDLELLETAKARVQERVAPPTWEAFRLLEEEDVSVDEVSARVGLQIAMVYVARSKVKRMLREEIEALEGDVSA